MKPLGQIANSFIVFDTNNGMLLMDQHAAVERINFEKFKAEVENNIVVTYPIFPISFEITPLQKAILLEDNIKKNLNENGFEYSIKDNLLNVIKVPTLIFNDEVAIKDILLSVTSNMNVDYVEQIHLKIATFACKASIKANKVLSFVEIKTLVEQLRKCKNPANCPHGRPTIIFISKLDIEKMFKRTGF